TLAAVNSAVNGGSTLTIQAAGTLTLNATTVSAPLVNQGTMSVTNNSSTVGGAFTNSGTLTVSADAGNTTTLTASAGLTNSGIINITGGTCCGAGPIISLVVSGGSLTNTSTGQIKAINGPGSQNGTRTLTATINN